MNSKGFSSAQWSFEVEAMASSNINFFRNENPSNLGKRAFGIVQVYSCLTATTISRGGPVMYKDDIVLLIFSAALNRHLYVICPTLE